MLKCPDLRSVVEQDTGVRVNGKQPADITLREFTKQNSFSYEFHLESVRLTVLPLSRERRESHVALNRQRARAARRSAAAC